MAMPSAWVDRIFVRLGEMYGAKFAAAWAGQDIARVKTTWAEGLEGISAEWVSGGLKRCLREEWPPSLPKFRSLCLPDFEMLFTIAQVNPRASALAYWAVQRFGYHEMRRTTWSNAAQRWGAVCEQLISDGVPELPEEAPQVEHKVAADPQRAGEAIGALRDMTAGKRDHLAWARKILARLERGERVSRISEQFAREALGL